MSSFEEANLKSSRFLGRERRSANADFSLDELSPIRDASESERRGAMHDGTRFFSAARLHGANLSGASTRGADLRQTSLADAIVQGADLVWAQLGEASLEGIDLRGVHGCVLGLEQCAWSSSSRKLACRRDKTPGHAFGSNTPWRDDVDPSAAHRHPVASFHHGFEGGIVIADVVDGGGDFA